jgi:hypothetical protein
LANERPLGISLNQHMSTANGLLLHASNAGWTLLGNGLCC